jgi:cytochrome oxidase assembly protein ShyY1
VSRRIPIIPTLIVLIAAAIMVGFGIWQIARAKEKEALLAKLEAAPSLPPIAYPEAPLPADDLPLFRRATATCVDPGSRRTIPGRSIAGEIGYVHIVRCRRSAEEADLSVAVGWSKNPNAPFSWSGGKVQGLIAADSETGMRIVAERPLPGLQAPEPPSLESIPNNHRAYVATWFSFAGLALLIYGLALRGRNRASARQNPVEGRVN